MKHRIYAIEFDGYWRGVHQDRLPSLCGVFCVYACQDHPGHASLQLLRLIGIESAEDVHAFVGRRIAGLNWYQHLQGTEELCFNFGHVSPEDRLRCEAALVNCHQPLEASDFKESFPFNETTVSIHGQIALLHPHFTVHAGRGPTAA